MAVVRRVMQFLTSTLKQPDLHDSYLEKTQHGRVQPRHLAATQAIGVVAYGIFCLICATIIFKVVTIFMGLRVSEEEEIIGLDIGEHDMESYAGFQIFSVE